MSFGDHPHIRNGFACPRCFKRKNIGLLVCWPCNNALKRANGGGYGNKFEALLDHLEDYLASPHPKEVCHGIAD